MAPSTLTHILNDMLQGEIAATETYQQAMAKIGNEPGSEELRRIHAEHREAANFLRQYVLDHGDEPSQGSGVWGAFAKTVEGVAKLFGNTAALKALKLGEENGIATYRAALTDEHLSIGCIEMIRTTLLPQTQAHVMILDRIMQNV